MKIPKFKNPTYSLTEAIDGLMAWDHGCRDSGIKDDDLRKSVKDYLLNLSETEYRVVIGAIAAEMLSIENLNQGYGLEDVVEFSHWLEKLSWE